MFSGYLRIYTVDDISDIISVESYDSCILLFQSKSNRLFSCPWVGIIVQSLDYLLLNLFVVGWFYDTVRVSAFEINIDID